MEKSREHGRLLSPEEIDGLETDSHELSSFSERNSVDSTSQRLRDYESANAYSRGRGAGLYNSIMARLSPKAARHVIIGVAIALLLILGASMMPKKGGKTWIMTSITPSEKEGKEAWKKPEGIKISAVLFYGRAQFVDILDCYLRQNLAVNGGYLDEVMFMENTDKQADIDYLQNLVAEVPQYRRVPVKRPEGHGWGGFDTMWTDLQDEDTIYLKIDDDIVWIHEDAVPRMIETLLKHPEAHDIGGNIINSPITNWLHYHNEAVHPYLPEPAAPAVTPNESDWRPSHLPQHTGDIPETYNFDTQADRPKNGFQVGDKGGPTYENHRWLPLKNTSQELMKTPIAGAEYDAFGKAWWSWAIAAQQHYSLFENLERGLLSRYHFGNAEGIWNMHYGRYNLNFLAIWGSSVAMKLPGRDDEQDLTVTIPKEFWRPCLVDSHALVAHFNFGTQPELIHTDLLDRYRAYANEFICKADNQKKRLPKPQKPEEVPEKPQHKS